LLQACGRGGPPRRPRITRRDIASLTTLNPPRASVAALRLEPAQHPANRSPRPPYDREQHGDDEDADPGRSRHAPDDGNPDRLARARARAGGDRKRHEAENQGNRGHHHRAEALLGPRARRLGDGLPVFAQLACEPDDQDRVLRGNPDQSTMAICA
jgi:hypothetical protein